MRERFGESLRARLRVATELAIGGHVDRARTALRDLEAVGDAPELEMAARYHLAWALLRLKERSIEDAFAAFERALWFARRWGDAALTAGVLTNYGTAVAQDGDISIAVGCFEEARRVAAQGNRRFVTTLCLAEALFGSGALERAAMVMHELYEGYSDTVTLICAAAIGIPLGLMLNEAALSAKSYDPALIDLAFSRGEQWLIGPLVEAFCLFYEHEGQRREHDELLRSALEKTGGLDNSLPLAVRAARTGDARELPRIGKFVRLQCAPASTLHAARRQWYDAAVASRHGHRAQSRRGGIEAAEGFERCRRPLLQAAALENAGLSDEARAVLRGCGAVTFPRVRWKAAAIRQRSAELTARELEVARLAAKRLPNRTIASMLGLSERTVHRHCESIFAKLGIHSRWQLSTAALDADEPAG